MALFKNILCPVDFSPCSRDALAMATALASGSDAALTLAHVWELSPYVTTGLMSGGDAIEAMIGDAERMLADCAASAKASAASTRTVLVKGVPWAEIIRLLEVGPAFDLVVMGTHGRTGLKHALVGSVAERVVRHAPCAVLVVR